MSPDARTRTRHFHVTDTGVLRHERLPRYVDSSESMPQPPRTSWAPDLGRVQVETRMLHEHRGRRQSFDTDLKRSGPTGIATVLIDLRHRPTPRHQVTMGTLGYTAPKEIFAMGPVTRASDAY